VAALAACPARRLTDQRKDTRRVDHRKSQATLVRSSESTRNPTRKDRQSYGSPIDPNDEIRTKVVFTGT